MTRTPGDTPRDLEPGQAILESKIRTHYASLHPPPGLRERIVADASSPGPPARERRGRYIVAVACAVLVTTLLMVSGERSEELTPSAFASVMIDELHTFAVSGRDLDVTAADPGVVQAWFKPRIEFHPPLPPQQNTGLVLKGGRLCHIFNQRVASYMYEHNGKVVSLYVLDGANEKTANAFTSDYERGFAHAEWRQGGLQYSLVGALPLDRLKTIASSLRDALRS